MDYNANATATICTTNTATTCNPDFNVSQLGASTTWKPVKNLALIAEATWTHIDQRFTGTDTLNGRPVTYGDTDKYSGIFRIQRNF